MRDKAENEAALSRTRLYVPADMLTVAQWFIVDHTLMSNPSQLYTVKKDFSKL